MCDPFNLNTESTAKFENSSLSDFKSFELRVVIAIFFKSYLNFSSSKKLSNDEHHDEFEMSGINLEKIRDMVKNHYILHNHNADKKDINSKWNRQIKLEKVSVSEIPEHIYNNIKFYSEWIAE